MARFQWQYRAIWWRGRVKLVRGKIIPVELNRYNPFDWYFPFKGDQTRRTRSLYHLFTDVNARDPQEVSRFCEKFGVLGNAQNTWESWNQWGLLPKKAFPTEFVDDEISYRMHTKHRNPPHKSFCTPMTLIEFQQEQNAMKDALTLLKEVEKAKSNKRNIEARQDLSSKISGELTKVGIRPVWDKKSKGWHQQWDSLSLVALMYLMLNFDMQGPGRNRSCKKCGNPFLAEHPRSEYCSPTCQNSAKVARHRKVVKLRDQQRLRVKRKES